MPSGLPLWRQLCIKWGGIKGLSLGKTPGKTQGSLTGLSQDETLSVSSYEASRFWPKFLLSLWPYLAVAGLLMAYNYLHFDSVTEFGQAYQLTVADQTIYRDLGKHFHWTYAVNGTFSNLLGFQAWTRSFPYVRYGGILVNFPLFLAPALCLLPQMRLAIRNAGLRGIWGCLLGLIPLISFLQALWSPYPLERYRLDLYFLCAISAYIALGLWAQQAPEDLRRQTLANRLALAGLCMAVFLFLLPFDQNPTEVYPHYLEFAEQSLLFLRRWAVCFCSGLFHD